MKMNNFTDKDKNLINEFYKPALGEYGPYDARAVRWSNFFSQNIRFQTLVEIADLENKNILDVGCGLGDFYFFLKSNFKKFNYLGIDVLENFINEARGKYPEAEFKNIEVVDVEPEDFDYAFASGVFSLKIDNYYEKYTSLIEEIFHKVKKGFAFNMLEKGKHIDDEHHVTYEPKDIVNFCKNFTKKVELKENYLDYDFSIFLYK